MGSVIALKRLLYIILLIVGVTAVSYFFVNATHISGSGFQLYLNATGSVGVQLAEFNNVTLTINQGELNSSGTTVSNNYMRGYLIFNSSTPGNFTVDFSEGVQVSYNKGGYLDTGTLINYAALTSNILQWDVKIYDPFEDYFFPVIGLIGFIMTAASGFYTAQTIRNRDEDVMKYSYGIVLLILGIGFIMVWFYG